VTALYRVPVSSYSTRVTIWGQPRTLCLFPLSTPPVQWLPFGHKCLGLWVLRGSWRDCQWAQGAVEGRLVGRRAGRAERGFPGSQSGDLPSGPCVQCFSGDNSAQPIQSGGEDELLVDPKALCPASLTTQPQARRPPPDAGPTQTVHRDMGTEPSCFPRRTPGRVLGL
jgi:hypothetical protein